ncbi:Uncharacterised protein [Staphylococcus aureus]|nr:Uncharacterised protein [Staphylococcus aureus]
MTTAPPELPGFTDASIWKAFINISYLLSLSKSIGTFLFRPEIIPSVTVPLKSTPSGLPTTNIGSPNTKLFESPIAISFTELSEEVALTTAKSDHLSLPSTFPTTLLLFEKVIF